MSRDDDPGSSFHEGGFGVIVVLDLCRAFKGSAEIRLVLVKPFGGLAVRDNVRNRFVFSWGNDFDFLLGGGVRKVLEEV